MKTRVSLDEELAKLSRDVPPPRELWPGVVRGIVRTPRSAPRLSSVPWMAYAASAAGLCLAAALAVLGFLSAQPAQSGQPAQPPQQSAAPFPAPMPSGTFAR